MDQGIQYERTNCTCSAFPTRSPRRRITSLTVPYDLVVSGSNHYVYLVTDEEVGVLKKLYKFDKNNIRMWC